MARVCPSFTEPALDVFWRKLVGLDLLSILPIAFGGVVMVCSTTLQYIILLFIIIFFNFWGRGGGQSWKLFKTMLGIDMTHVYLRI